MASDKDKCDLLIVMGSSLKVRPVALIPSSIPNNVPQILINREQLHHLEFDVELLGDGDVIINQICHRLSEDWKGICFDDEVLVESKELVPLEYQLDDEDTAKEISTNIDTISVQSNQSSDLALQTPNTTTTTYSDFGFESSSTCSKKDNEFISPEYTDEPMESTSFGGSCDYRHLSIDSSKDSGILGDASNSCLTPSFSNLVDAVDMKKSFNMSDSTTEAISNKPSMDDLNNTKTVDTHCSEVEKQRLRRQTKHQSAAERLHKGTYYVHENSASYVFPGAQVSWSSDSEEDDDDNLDDYPDNQCNEDDDTNHAPLSPLMTPSVENEMVKAITSTGGTSNSTFQHPQSNCSSANINEVPSYSCLQSTCQQNKRRSNDDPAFEHLEIHTLKSFASETKTSAFVDTSPPPHKKRRDSTEQTIFSTSTNYRLESS